MAAAVVAAASAPSDTVTLNDGTAINLARVPDVDEATWDEVKAYLADNPERAKTLQGFAQDPEKIRGWLQTQAIARHYQSALENGDTPVQERIQNLEQDPELAAMFDDIKRNGMEAIMKYYNDEEAMLKVSKKMGGLPEEVAPALQKIEETSLTLHEACKKGDLKSVNEHVASGKPVDVQDAKGITPLGYAIGANRIAVVKQLLDSRANPFAVDSSGNSGLHYAAGYGRKELTEYLLKTGAAVNQSNAQGQTPLSVATMNRHNVVIGILQKAGAQ